MNRRGEEVGSGNSKSAIIFSCSASSLRLRSAPELRTREMDFAILLDLSQVPFQAGEESGVVKNVSLGASSAVWREDSQEQEGKSPSARTPQSEGVNGLWRRRQV